MGVTDRKANFPEIGRLHKGAPKPERGIGRDLDYLRFASEDKAMEQRFFEAYGPKPASINVFLPHPTVDENWSAWREEWSASTLRHRCDGVYCVAWLDDKGKMHHADNGESQPPCPGGCKQVGRLRVVIPELKRLAYVTVETTSINDIIRIQEQIEALVMASRTGSLQGMPMVVRRSPVTITKTRMENGKAVHSRGASWLLSLEASLVWTARQFESLEAGAMPDVPQLVAGRAETATETVYAPPAPNPEQPVHPPEDDDDADEGDFTEPAADENGELVPAVAPLISAEARDQWIALVGKASQAKVDLTPFNVDLETISLDDLKRQYRTLQGEIKRAETAAA